MKKLSLVLITLMVFFSAGISVLAETIEQKDVDVTAQYIPVSYTHLDVYKRQKKW